MDIIENYSLKLYNTFGIEAKAKYFVDVSTINDLRKVLVFRRQKDLPILFIGGGSNMLFVDNFPGIVLKLNLKGIEILKEDNDYVYVKSQGSENWHHFVEWTLEHDFGGLENLSLIPGNVGTAPMQNIGAYGVEVKDYIVEVQTLELETGNERIFTNEECHFGYRESIFKNELRGKYVLVAVTFKLTKQNHQLHVDYGAIKTELDSEQIINPTIQDISRAVIKIRESKLPDPSQIGNSGSFFKNPVISNDEFAEIEKNHPQIAHYKTDSGIKLAAGWLIEQAGWKGKRFGDAGVHDKQALVLVNYGNATGKEIYDLSEQIIEDVKAKYGVTLEREVNIIK
ncbi:UDP-N-acetylmuramate dehydrogenase [Algoriella xinjiangensis]|uniref:UDP-N-acetylenolpyruvoylglucosamine reductase n=1 Tax=Algoriella xinjiangensis TaxID=684065 RepID=A0A1I4Y4F7_9FLAO|nr:UDP-N-acetylmuramate dehydrogenase [Algoriella xinjiangensis]SFN32946.1 UDP-N-acetylmuramate dehydrogenase [Algoriella xinjiangensis]VDH15290.1 UDP-N-acetylenolpyruvoylglucosamine reductase [Algoriella xinjiangensis]